MPWFQRWYSALGSVSSLAPIRHDATQETLRLQPGFTTLAEILRHSDYRIVSERREPGREHSTQRIGVTLTIVEATPTLTPTDIDSAATVLGLMIDSEVTLRSGEIEFRDVRDDFVVERDSSGDIVADTIGGDFRVLSDSSGDIDLRGVQGEVEIPDKG